MKTVTLVVVCAALIGCTPTPNPGASTPNPGTPPAPQVTLPPFCPLVPPTQIAVSGAASLIRTRTFWLLDLAGCNFDINALIAGVRRCNGINPCGTVINPQTLANLETQLAQAPLTTAMLAGAPLNTFRVGARTVFQWGADRNTEQILGHLSGIHQPAVPGPNGPLGAAAAPAPAAVGGILCCPACVRCIPEQCDGAPTPPPRFEVGEDGGPCDCDVVCAARASGQPLPNCACDTACRDRCP